MKNALGMIRSKEMMKAKPKVIKHIEVTPNHETGGVTVEHHFMEHPKETHDFAKEQGNEFADHMMAHSGMSYHDGAGDTNEVNKEGAEAE